MLAAGYSVQGLRLAWREPAFRQELVLAAVLLPIAALLPFSALERIVLIGSVLLVLIVELLNTGLESIVDRVSTERHALSGRAKDMGSAAVFIALVFAALTWLTIAGPVVWGMIAAG